MWFRLFAVVEALIGERGPIPAFDGNCLFYNIELKAHRTLAETGNVDHRMGRNDLSVHQTTTGGDRPRFEVFLSTPGGYGVSVRV